jgi:hypothetical protein
MQTIRPPTQAPPSNVPPGSRGPNVGDGAGSNDNQPTASPAADPGRQPALGRQFDSDRARQGLGRVLDAYSRARYFQRAGLAEALRFTLDPQGYRPARHFPTVRGRQPLDIDVDRTW